MALFSCPDWISKVRGNYVDVELLDTYDFNKNEKNPLVKMGRSVQETEKLTHTIWDLFSVIV